MKDEFVELKVRIYKESANVLCKDWELVDKSDSISEGLKDEIWDELLVNIDEL